MCAKKRKPANPGIGMTEKLEVRSLLSANSVAIISTAHQTENQSEHIAGDHNANQTHEEAAFGRNAMKAKKPKPNKDNNSHQNTEPAGPSKPNRDDKAEKPSKHNKHNNSSSEENDPYFLQPVISNTAPSIVELGDEAGNYYFPGVIDSLSTYGANALEQSGNSADWNTALQRLENIATGLVNDGWKGAAQAAVPGILDMGDDLGNYYFPNLISSLSDYGAGAMEQTGGSSDWNTALQRLDDISNSFINEGWLGAAQAGLPAIEELGNDVGDYYFPGLINSLSDYGANAWESWSSNNPSNSYSIVYDDNAPKNSDPGQYFSGSDWDTAWQQLQQIGYGYYNDGWEGAAAASLPVIGQLGEDVGSYYFPDWIDSASDYGASLYDTYNNSGFSDNFWSAFDAAISQYGSYDYGNYDYPAYDYPTHDYGYWDYGGGSSYTGYDNSSRIVFDDNAPKASY